MATAIEDKLRGGYYTPLPLAKSLCDWAIRSPNDSVLEPSCGDGAFLACAAARFASLKLPAEKAQRQIVGIEVAAAEAVKAAARTKAILGRAIDVAARDFFRWSKESPDQLFDCVVGNPPFIRYQNFPEPSRSLAMARMQQCGLAPNRLTNIWVPFVVAAVQHLKPGGRLAMVLPAELLQVSYAAQLRLYLVERFRSIEIISCNDLVFEDAEQEVMLLRADEKLSSAAKDNPCRISLHDAHGLPEVLAAGSASNGGEPKLVKHESEKWLKYFLSAPEIEFMRAMKEHPAVVPAREHVSIDVGVVTGRNDFFLVTLDQIAEYELRPFVVPLVGRSFQLKGAVFGRAELRSLASCGDRVHLLAIPPNINGSLTGGVLDYIRFGEKQGAHVGYKCSTRTPWYSVPSAWLPDGFFFRQIYDFPKVVANKANATSTDTIHRLKCRHSPIQAVAASFYTHLSAASAEIEGRSYGGGVLELEPTEAERLLMPRPLGGGLHLDEVDRLLREGRLADVLEQNDNLVLRKQLSLSRGLQNASGDLGKNARPPHGAEEVDPQ